MCKRLPHFMVFGFLNENIIWETLHQASGWESQQHGELRTPPPPLLSPSRLGRRGNYIIWRWNESTLQAKVSEMLYCSRNCQLKSNTWNAEAQLKQSSPSWWGWMQAVPCTTEAPGECFSFRHFFYPPFTLLLFVKRCRQCTFTSAYIDHKSPKPDVLLNVLIKPISWVEHMAGLQYKPAQATLLRKKTEVILSSTQSTVGTPRSNTYTHVYTSTVPDVFHALVSQQTKVSKQKGGERKNVLHIPPEQTAINFLKGALVSKHLVTSLIKSSRLLQH